MRRRRTIAVTPALHALHALRALVSALLAIVAFAGCKRSSDAGAARHEVVRCAVIGGMVTSGVWAALSERYEKETGDKVELTVSGNDRMIVDPMRRGDVDLLTMHASDAIVNLVADGYAQEPEPWARNEHVIVGPTDDPAHVRGMTDAAAALAKIVAAKSPFVAHRGHGSTGLLRELTREAHVELDEEHLFRVKPTDNQETVLELASQKHAYSLVGRIPVKVGKMQGAGIEVLVQGDPRLRRPFVVVVADPKRSPNAHVAAARRLAAYLRSPATQAWLATYTNTTFGDAPPFFPVTVEGEAQR